MTALLGGSRSCYTSLLLSGDARTLTDVWSRVSFTQMLHASNRSNASLLAEVSVHWLYLHGSYSPDNICIYIWIYILYLKSNMLDIYDDLHYIFHAKLNCMWHHAYQKIYTWLKACKKLLTQGRSYHVDSLAYMVATLLKIFQIFNIYDDLH